MPNLVIISLIKIYNMSFESQYTHVFKWSLHVFIDGKSMFSIKVGTGNLGRNFQGQTSLLYALNSYHSISDTFPDRVQEKDSLWCFVV